MDPIKFRLQYDQLDEPENRLPAHLGAKSLEGITWSVSLVGSYLATRKISKRGSLSPKIRFFIAPATQGSFITDLVGVVTDPNNLFMTSIFGQYAISSATTIINSVFSHTFMSVCGLRDDHSIEDDQILSRLPSGELEALVDAVEPSMIRGHAVIGEGANVLNIHSGRDTIITINSATKRYIESNFVSEDHLQRIGRVGALNSNTGNGRIYMPELERIVPFTVVKEPEEGTYVALSNSQNLYTKGLPCDVIINAKDVLATDGRIKKFLIRSAHPPSSANVSTRPSRQRT